MRIHATLTALYNSFNKNAAAAAAAAATEAHNIMCKGTH
jgi:hypothetical protein